MTGMRTPLELKDKVQTTAKPVHPWLVLALAVILPGVGHVAARMPQRGLVFVFFILLLGWITFHLTTPEHSLIGRYAGGLLIYTISILDAYKWAKVQQVAAGRKGS
jgi:hypothetical protein